MARWELPFEVLMRVLAYVDGDLDVFGLVHLQRMAAVCDHPPFFANSCRGCTLIGQRRYVGPVPHLLGPLCPGDLVSSDSN